MDQELKKKWVKALLSGRYKQGRSALYRGHETYCCLGVLGVVCRVPKNELLGHGFPEDFDVYRYQKYTTAIPVDVTKKTRRVERRRNSV